MATSSGSLLGFSSAGFGASASAGAEAGKAVGSLGSHVLPVVGCAAEGEGCRETADTAPAAAAYRAAQMTNKYNTVNYVYNICIICIYILYIYKCYKLQVTTYNTTQDWTDSRHS